MIIIIPTIKYGFTIIIKLLTWEFSVTTIVIFMSARFVLEFVYYCLKRILELLLYVLYINRYCQTCSVL